MRTIATLGPSVRLVVFQFLMKSAQVPAIIPPKRASEAPPLPLVSGKEVLESTPKLNIFPLADGVCSGENYELVDAWAKPHETNWNMSFVRFVFCRKEHIKPLSPDFLTKRGQLEDVFDNLVATNLWATQAHLNLYFDSDAKPTSQKVLMLGCAGRTPNTEVFAGGRDENNRGIGPKVLMSTISSRLELENGEVFLETPSSVTSEMVALILGN